VGCAEVSGKADRLLALIAAMQRAEAPQTVTELAEITGITPSSVYTAMKALERTGRAEKKGVALNGGQTWVLTTNPKEA